MDTYNILGLTKEKLDKVISCYKKGDAEFTLGGKKYWINNLHEIRIFTHEKTITPADFKEKAIETGHANSGFGGGYYLSPKVLAVAGKDVTDELIGDSEFGGDTVVAEETSPVKKYFIDPKRVEELKNVTNKDFDLTRLISFCEELNDNYSRDNYLSVAMLGRSILNHVPPIFGFTTFNEVANNHGGTSFKKIMSHLNTTMRGIADSFLHDTIRKKESLPNSTQVNFSQDLDVLLAEVVRKLNEK
jgi:hypothetical protein